jgi:hypothetical protein
VKKIRAAVCRPLLLVEVSDIIKKNENFATDYTDLHGYIGFALIMGLNKYGLSAYIRVNPRQK